MIKRKFTIGYNKIDWIAHLSDIHIRNLRRHKEYKEVFSRVYDIIREFDGNGIIYVGGDIVHAKTQMSPELIQLTSDFLSSLANITYTIVIPGNHDMNLNNRHRLDALTPIINNLNHPKLFYLKESGIYEFGDLTFVTMPVTDSPRTYIKAKDVTGKTKIALYHGAVSKAKTDFGYKLDGDIKINKFTGYDFGLLGDIHKHQFLNRKKTIAYPGSLLAQNFGEDLYKGFIKWDLSTRKGTFIRVYNPYGYYTIDIQDGKLPDIHDMPEKARLRLRLTNTDSVQLNNILHTIKKQYGITEVIVNRLDSLSKTKLGDRNTEINIGDVSDVNYQYSLIKDYLSRNYTIDKEILDEIKQINATINRTLPEEDISRNVFWSLKTFEFENMFSYGTGNKIDFSSLSGINGIFAPNSSGKSAAFDALSFCLYDTSGRTYKAAKVLNNKKNSFKCTVNFEIDGIDYFIHRKAKKLKNGHVKADVDFWMIDDSGEKISLNGDQRRSTNANIRKVIGTYEDFIMTSLSLQNNFTVFIDKTQKERKELLAQFMGIGIFDKLYTYANEEISEVSAILKDFRTTNYDDQLVEIDKKLSGYKIEYSTLSQQKVDTEVVESNIKRKLLKLSKKIRVLDDSITDINGLKTNKLDLLDKIDFALTNISAKKTKLSEIDTKLTQYADYITHYESNDFEKQYVELIKYEKEKTDTVVEIDKLKIDVQHKLTKLSKLKNLEYDPNCSYCMNNIFVKDAIETKRTLDEDKIRAKKYIDKLDNLNGIIDGLISVRSSKLKYDTLIQDREKLIHIKSTIGGEINTILEQIKNYKQQISIIDEKILQYDENKKYIEENIRLEKNIEKLDQELNEIESKLELINDKLQSVHGQIKVFESQRRSILDKIDKVERLERKYQAYEYYMDAVKRDGVPYELIEKSLPVIENEINSILEQIVDFSIILEMDGKNINTYIVYDEDNVWPLELAGGMERFISSIALRVGLTNVSNLPRMNGLILDEGFGNADSDMLGNIGMLFQYLKSQYSFTMIVSHIEQMRDTVDYIIEIDKVDGYSQINS